MASKKKATASARNSRKKRGSRGAEVTLHGRDRIRSSRAGVRGSPKTTGRYVQTAATREAIREASERLSIQSKKLEVAVAAARLGPEAFEVVETLVALHSDPSAEEAERRARAYKGFRGVLPKLLVLDEDPLAEFDDATEDGIYQAQIRAEFDIIGFRKRLLEWCVDVKKAEELSGSKRQSLERLRKAGRLLALRVEGGRWRYPSWQFDPDCRGGVVPGLDKVIQLLHLSPTGAAAWLTKPSKALGGRRPIDMLRSGQAGQVIELAEDRGYLP